MFPLGSLFDEDIRRNALILERQGSEGEDLPKSSAIQHRSTSTTQSQHTRELGIRLDDRDSSAHTHVQDSDHCFQHIPTATRLSTDALTESQSRGKLSKLLLE